MCTKNVCLFQQVLLKARSFANEAGLPFLITEYKDGLQGGPGNATVHSGHHGDRSYAAAFVMRNIPLLTSLDMLSYWTFTDGKCSRSLCVSFRRSSKKAVAQCSRRAGACPAGPSTANSGASRRKESGPVWRAFQSLHQAGDTIYNVTVDGGEGTISAFATTESGGSDLGAKGLQVFVTNFWPMAGATADPQTPSAANVSLTITGAKLPATAFLWRIDDNTTRAMPLWQEMGEPHYPTPAQLTELNRASEMQSEELHVGAGGQLTFSLPPFGVGIVRFSEASY